jgi:hypothetical protein
MFVTDNLIQPNVTYHSSLLVQFVSYKEYKHFILFVTYEWTQLARVLHYTRLERLARGKHFSLLGLLVIYEEFFCVETVKD